MCKVYKKFTARKYFQVFSTQNFTAYSSVFVCVHVCFVCVECNLCSLFRLRGMANTHFDLAAEEARLRQEVEKV